MLASLISLLALLAGAHCVVFNDPVQIDFLARESEDPKDCQWAETTDPLSEEQEQSKSKIVKTPNTIGQLALLGTDDGRSFNWSNGSGDAAVQYQCDVWLDHKPNISKSGYSVSLTDFIIASDNEHAPDTTPLHIVCDVVTPISSPFIPFIPLSSGLVGRHAATTQASAADPQPTSGAADLAPPPFDNTLTVTFYGDSGNVPEPAWWRDSTKYNTGGGNTDRWAPDDVYDEPLDGASYLGHMKFTHIPLADRTYSYQVKLKSGEKVGRVQGCHFTVKENPTDVLGVPVDKIWYWVEGNRVEARMAGKPVVADESKLKDLISNSCTEMSLEDGKVELKQSLT